MERYFLQPGFVYISDKHCIIHTILGSCVAVALWDSNKKYGGMNHYIYSRSVKNERNCRYGDVSMHVMINYMLFNKSRLCDLRAHIAGGSSSSEYWRQLGVDNYETAAKILGSYGIPIVSCDVGGFAGRKVVFDNCSGEMAVSSRFSRRHNILYE